MNSKITISIQRITLLSLTAICLPGLVAGAADKTSTIRKVDPILRDRDVDRYGYYMFLGLGDYLGDSPLATECWSRGFKLPRCPVAQKDYICTWDLEAWKQAVNIFDIQR